MSSPVVLEGLFNKLHGGILKNQKQSRTVKLHENNYISYYRGKDIRGYFPLSSDTQVTLNPNHEDCLKIKIAINYKKDKNSKDKKVKDNKVIEF